MGERCGRSATSSKCERSVMSICSHIVFSFYFEVYLMFYMCLEGCVLLMSVLQPG